MHPETMKADRTRNAADLRKLVLANNSEDTFSPLDLQVTRLRRRFDIAIPVALTIARLAYGEARQ
jgi:hypothetical protein